MPVLVKRQKEHLLVPILIQNIKKKGENAMCECVENKIKKEAIYFLKTNNLLIT